MKVQRWSLMLFIACLVLGAIHCYAETEDFGIVMDLSGKVTIKHGVNTKPADLGSNIVTGDMIIIDKKAKAVIVSYGDCLEWSLSEAKRFIVKGGTILVNGKPLPYSRRLPVCYSMDEIKKAGSEPVGGFVLRGPNDPLAELREEFNSGKASNSTIMILLMHELNRGEVEKARPYYEFLKKHLPDSEFITNIATLFKSKV
jgi:hypothetical protein